MISRQTPFSALTLTPDIISDSLSHHLQVFDATLQSATFTPGVVREDRSGGVPNMFSHTAKGVPNAS